MFTLGGLLKLFGDLFAVIGPLAIQQIVQYIEVMYGIHYDKYNSNSNSNNNIALTATTKDSGHPDADNGVGHLGQNISK